MLGQNLNILTPLAQGRQAQTNHIQTVKQVLAKHAFFDALLKVLVGGGNDAHIGFDGAVSAHTVEMTIGQNTQQTRLQIKRHVTNFVQEQGAAFSLLKTTTPGSLSARKCTAFVTKQFAFKQIFGNGSRVDGHKRTIGTRRMLVQRAGNQFFARARFAGDHDRDVALRQTTNGAKYILHGRRLAQHFWCGSHHFFGHIFALTFGQSTPDQLDGFG